MSIEPMKVDYKKNHQAQPKGQDTIPFVVFYTFNLHEYLPHLLHDWPLIFHISTYSLYNKRDKGNQAGLIEKEFSLVFRRWTCVFPLKENNGASRRFFPRMKK